MKETGQCASASVSLYTFSVDLALPCPTRESIAGRTLKTPGCLPRRCGRRCVRRRPICSWLLSREYARESSLKLVGDRYGLAGPAADRRVAIGLQRPGGRPATRLSAWARSPRRPAALAGRLQRAHHHRGGAGRRRAAGRPRRHVSRHGQHARQLPQSGGNPAGPGTDRPHRGRAGRERVPLASRPPGVQQRPAEDAHGGAGRGAAAGAGGWNWSPIPTAYWRPPTKSWPRPTASFSTTARRGSTWRGRS